MRERLTEIMGPEGYRVGVHTFHNFCQRIKNRHSECFQDTAFFDAADNIVKIEILEEIFSELPHDWLFALSIRSLALTISSRLVVR